MSEEKVKHIKDENFELLRKLYSKKQNQDLVDENISLMQKAVEKENMSLWKILYSSDKEQEDFVAEIIPESSGYSNIQGIKTYFKLYEIQFRVGSRTYMAYFVFEDGEWRIPVDWDTYDF